MEEQIRATLESLRPALKADGGSVEYDGMDKDGNLVVRLIGFCGCCHATAWTHRLRVERALKEKFPGMQVAVLLGPAACTTD